MYSSLDFGVDTGNLELANFIIRSVTVDSASFCLQSTSLGRWGSSGSSKAFLRVYFSILSPD